MPCTYFHLVFTLPHRLNGLALQQPAMVYDVLFKAVWQTLHVFASKAGVQLGMISILHTWGQNLSLHPHLHCIVPGAGVNKKGRWQHLNHSTKFLFPVKALSKVFRARYVQCLRQCGFADKAVIESLFQKPWVVYAKRPFTGPQSVIEYLGRYTHKIAISNHRIKNVDAGSVTFSYKDYKHGSVKKEMTLDAFEFIRRYSMHILPKGLVRIRHYGILSSTAKKAAAIIIKEQLPEAIKQVTTKPAAAPYNVKQCPCCKKETMQTLMGFKGRGPPVEWEQVATDLLSCITNITTEIKKMKLHKR